MKKKYQFVQKETEKVDKRLLSALFERLDERNEHQSSRNDKRQYQRAVNSFASDQYDVANGNPKQGQDNSLCGS